MTTHDDHRGLWPGDPPRSRIEPERELLPIPAISLHQPWTSLLFMPDFKVHETRSWRYPDRLHGRRILIHAAKKKTRPVDLRPILRTIMADRKIRLDDLPLGAFVGTARLADCIRTERYSPFFADEAAGDFSPGRFAWRLEDRRPLRAPIPARGRQGFWYLHPEGFSSDILKEHDLG